ncbi:hypothetical protein EVAR_88642_1 [Eumeta japonica]|uniref:Uncharacterized protein n=1 Tax=Eumeta variegata TaxID=151549 RepID=A0A4C1X1H5_EUMVA|nr:hypothetical protein EVAR_88642_1 [Eumeta japonica]
MKKVSSHSSLGVVGLNTRTPLHAETPSAETESLLEAGLPIIVGARGRRESLTAPSSPSGTRKKRDHPRHHNYINHLHHFIHWKDIWSGDTSKTHEQRVSIRASFVESYHEVNTKEVPNAETLSRHESPRLRGERGLRMRSNADRTNAT